MKFRLDEFDEHKVWVYRSVLKGVVCVVTTGIMIAGYVFFYRSVPDDLLIRKGEEAEIQFALPVSASIYEDSLLVSDFGDAALKKEGQESIEVMSTNKMVVKANEQNYYQMELKIFGVVPLKTVNLEVIEETEIYPVGLPIGIYVKTEGVLVVGISDFTGSDGMKAEPAKHILKEGDYILKVNEEAVEGKKDLIKKIRACEGNDLIFTILRNNELTQVKCKPALADDGEYKLGIWIRDSAQGIGTMTYLDKNGNYGALGHGINDVDTNTLMDLNYGGIYQTDIIGIQKGTKGTPGELTGFIDFEDDKLLGSVDKNTKGGIFGTLSKAELNQLNLTSMEIGLKQEIKTGKAKILCKIGEQNKFYDIEILKVNYDSEDDNRGLVIRITDEELLEMTGGIVQGMSGSPIIQNDKVIGAVTHVLINDSTKGYGIFIEEMLEH